MDAATSWVLLAVAAVVLWRIARGHRHAPPVSVAPSHIHSEAYDALHKSAYWRKLRVWIYQERACGRCERCRRRRPLGRLQLHCLHYRFLDTGEWPTLADVMLLCVPCHNRADGQRRRRNGQIRSRGNARRVESRRRARRASTRRGARR